MSLLRRAARPVSLPAWLAVLVPLAAVLVAAWAFALATDRNPLPFPDRHYHVFSAASPEGLSALEDVLEAHGVRPRFRADSEGVARTIFSNGTIVNLPTSEFLAQTDLEPAALGLVVADPDASARAVAEQLRARGFAAEALHGAEPGLPIAFVRTNALAGSALVFRKPVTQMGPPPPRWTPRADTSG